MASMLILVHLSLSIPRLVMKLHFYRLGYSIQPGQSDYAVKIADLVELSPKLLWVCNRALHLAKYVLKGVFYGLICLSIAVVGSFVVLPFVPFTLLCALFYPLIGAILFAHGLPATKAAFIERLTYISTIQNRLLASTKKGHQSQ